MSLQREREIKLDMMESIAASQRAVARMLNSIADVTPHSDISAKSMEEHIRLLGGYQARMAQMLSGISLRHPIHGTPAPPWMNTLNRGH